MKLKKFAYKVRREVNKTKRGQSKVIKLYIVISTIIIVLLIWFYLRNLYGANRLISDTAMSSDIDKWKVAYSWGNHNEAGYIKQESDPIYSSSYASQITEDDLKKIKDAYSWGNHADAGYLKSFTETDPKYSSSPVSKITANDIANWNSKESAIPTGTNSQYLRGDKTWQTFPTCSSAQSLAWNGSNFVCVNFPTHSELDPIFTASPANSITNTLIANWNTAYSWGDHAAVGYLTTESDPVFGASPANSITNTVIANWNTAFSWGNHAAVGYLTTESDPVFTASVAALITAADVLNWNNKENAITPGTISQFFRGDKTWQTVPTCPISNALLWDGTNFVCQDFMFNTTNLRLGTDAGFNITNGFNNTFIGYQSGYSNADGIHNTFVGYNSGYLNTSGYSNTFIGNNSGYSTTSGSFNTFIGNNSGYSNINGMLNTFIGNASGYSNVDGILNTFIGHNSGYYTTSGSFNIFIGVNSGYYNTTGSLNTFVGLDSGYSNTTGNQNTFIGQASGSSNTTGINNTFIGQASGAANITGNSNTFVGQASGVNNVGGELNTFVGQLSGLNNTTGSSNTFLGQASGASNTTGERNTFVGSSTGYSNTTGGLNTFVGSNSGYSNTNGSLNTFMGLDSGYFNNTGSANTFIGHSSGYNNTSGSWNTFVGRSSGIANTTGILNTFIGEGSGYSNITGSYNTFIGTNSGMYYGSGSSFNTSSSNSILIGHYARPQNDNQTNQIVIGNQAIGAGSNTTTIGNTSITATYLRGSLVASDNILNGTTRVDIAGTGTGWAVCHSGSATATDDVFLVDCTSTPSADYMEMYPVESNAQIGDILMTSNDYVLTQDNERIVRLIRVNGINNHRVIGVMSDRNKAGDFNSIGHNINASDNPQPIALSGRVYVNIDPSSPDIEPGDMITISNTPGKGTKLTGSGFIVGKALEAWSSTSGQTKVMIYIMNFYYNPFTVNEYFTLSGTTLTTDYSLVVNGSITANSLSLALGKFTVASNGNTVIDAVLQANQAVFRNLTIDKLSINTTPLVGDPIVGSGTITTGQTRVVINNSNVQSTSKIFITLTSSSTQVVSVINKTPGVSFEVSIPVPQTEDITFDYWIIN
jgi:hypothetical protein